MAQYTPNFNLYEPESTDDFADFRTEFNNNMNIIDQNLGGGGGSGGHTIIDENGQSMTQRTGLEFTGNVSVTDDAVNDKTVVDILGGGGNVYGAFIDTNRVIVSRTQYSGSFSYTATEDCFITLFMVLGASIEIDGEVVFACYSNNSMADGIGLYLRKGQILSVTGSGNNSSYAVYGLIQGTNGIFAPVIYSDTERVIGVWRDNKPLYQRTLYFSGISTNPTAQIDISSLGAENAFGVLEGSIYTVSGVKRSFQSIGYESESSILVINTSVNRSNISGYVTVQYTKTTDTAGSGNWNTDGIPTVHYSTSEQVIGTWIDGKPIYKKTWDFSGSPVMLNYADWVNSGISAGENIKAIMSAELKYGAVILANVEVGVNVDGYPVGFQKLDNLNTRGVSYCTLIYTKTTD